MMKTRTRNAPAMTASGMMSHHDTDRLRYRRYQRSANGPSVLTICQMALGVEGCWYCFTIVFQSAGSSGFLSGGKLGFAVIINLEILKDLTQINLRRNEDPSKEPRQKPVTSGARQIRIAGAGYFFDDQQEFGVSKIKG